MHKLKSFSAWGKYLWMYSTPLLVVFSLASEHIFSYTALFVLFGVIPMIEIFIKGSTENLSKEQEEMVAQNPIFDWMLYLLLPAQYLLLFMFLEKSHEVGHTAFTRIGHIISMGLACGVIGINAAHELGHRKSLYERWMSRALLLSSCYMHFYIEHNRGHHKKVATPDDPATARTGEMIYIFWLRSVINSWLSAWKLENERLNRKGKTSLSLQNEMIQYTLIQIGFLLLIWWFYAWTGILYFLLASGIGVLMLETVNYIEHYGLSRNTKGVVYEQVKPIHSWNSNHTVGRLLLLELSRHSDHHYNSSRKYPVLRHFEENPQMPTGYPGMMLLSLVPPLWFRVMHPKLQQLMNQNTTHESPKASS